MLGNWSLGDYFKEESIKMSFDFLTKELQIPVEKLSVTCFAGDEDCPRDEVSAECWKKAGILDGHIYYYGKDDNWWIAGEEGPCGPDTEMFYDTGKPACGPDCQPSCDCGKYVEIWNNVFMEYFKDKNGYSKLKQKNVDTGLGLERMAMLLQGKECGKYVEIWNNVFMEYFKDKNGYSKLKQKNVDTGLGLERMAMLLQGKETPFDTEIFEPIMAKLEELEKEDIIESRRIVAEHLRSSMMIISDGGRPSNIDRGYVLRRLIRRMIRHMNKLQINLDELSNLIEINIQNLKEMYPELEQNKETIKSVIIEEKVQNLKEMYPELEQNKETIKSVIIEEKDKFVKTLAHGEREFLKEMKKAKEQEKTEINGEVVFKLYDTYGFPPEVTKDLAGENEMTIDMKKFEELFKKHQEKSRMGSTQKFKGGLADQNEKTISYHTATHLLHQALRTILGEHVKQSGSNITEERLRFDFTHPQKMTKEEIQKVEDLVNEQIKRDLEVKCEEMTYEEAKNSGAIGLFTDKYGKKVKVYTIGDFSKEICGGPHVTHTGDMGTFKIKKEESSSSGVRRIKAVLIK